MKTMYLNSDSLDMFLHQNKGEVIDCVEGCLLDNLLINAKRGTIALYEHYVNCWTSNYEVKFAPYKTEENLNLVNEFDDFRMAAETEECEVS